jgi:hypothetical protein
MVQGFTNWQQEWPPERLKERAQVGDADYLSLDRTVFLQGIIDGEVASEELDPRTIMCLDGFCLVETTSEPDDWYMGELRADGTIVCWGRYGNLATTLDSR